MPITPAYVGYTSYDMVHVCIVSKRLGSPYRFGRSADWIKVKNPSAPAVKREAEEEWR